MAELSAEAIALCTRVGKVVGTLEGVAIVLWAENMPRTASLLQDVKIEVARLLDAQASLLLVAEMVIKPERNACDQYHEWHARLKQAATAAIAKAAGIK